MLKFWYESEKDMNGLYVFIGGGLGALTRYMLTCIMPKNCYLPYCTLLANFFGCFIATVIFVYLVMKSDINSAYKSFFIVGFCGGLSTLSSLSLEVLNYLHGGEYLKTFLYIFVSILTCIIAVIFGIFLVKKTLCS